MKRVLLIAYHYPPIKGSSGLQRTLRYSMYLHQYGWQAQVLTVTPRAYESIGGDEIGEIPAHVKVHRAFALDTKRHLSLFGRYPRFLANPDRWASWYFDGVMKGRKIIREFKPHVIWSSYPIATAHKIAYRLARDSHLPWVADFRDLLTEDNWPRDPHERHKLNRFEQKIVAQAARCIFTTSGAASYYRQKYASEAAEKFVTLPNGYDEQAFAGVETPVIADGIKITLLHAGILYPSERDPVPFFKAIAALKAKGAVTADTLAVRLRATGHDDHHRPVIEALGISDIVELAGNLPYRQALEEMTKCHGLLIFQAENCNRQIPAKLYEYFRAGRPILALTHRDGDTARQILEENAGLLCSLDDVDEIAEQLEKFLIGIRKSQIAPMSRQAVMGYSRFNQSGDLAELLKSVVKNDTYNTI